MPQLAFILLFLLGEWLLKRKIDTGFGQPARACGSWLLLSPRRNYGLAGERGAAHPHRARLIASLAAVLLIALALWLWADINALGRWGLALVVAGGCGNALDRWTRGYVVDYIRLPWLPRRLGQLVFNLADLIMLLGLLLFALGNL